MKKRKVSLIELWCHLDLFTQCILGVPVVILACMGMSLLFRSWTVCGVDGQTLVGFDAIMAKTVAILVLGVIAWIFGYFAKTVISDIYHSRQYLLRCCVEEDIESEVNTTLQDKTIFEKAGIPEGTYKYDDTEKGGITIKDDKSNKYTVKPELLLRNISLYDEYFKYS